MIVTRKLLCDHEDQWWANRVDRWWSCVQICLTLFVSTYPRKPQSHDGSLEDMTLQQLSRPFTKMSLLVASCTVLVVQDVTSSLSGKNTILNDNQTKVAVR